MFEVQVPEFRLLQQCRREIKMLKQLWDYICLVRTSIDEWKTTPWKDIDVENMDMECKKFSKVKKTKIQDYYLFLFLCPAINLSNLIESQK